MTPGSRIQSAIELLGQILESWQSSYSPLPPGEGLGVRALPVAPPSSGASRHLLPKGEGKRIPADKLIENYFKSRRYIGSKDRAYIGELVYWCLRHKASLEWQLTEKLKSPVHARAIVLTALMLRKDYVVAELDTMSQDSKYALPKLTELEKKRCEMVSPLPSGEGAERSEAGEGIATYSNNSPAAPPSSGRFQRPPSPEGRREMPTHIRLNYPEWMNALLHESLGDDFEQALLALNEQAPTDLRVNTLKTTREQLQKELQNENFDVEPTKLSPIGLRLKKRAPIFTSRYFKEGYFEVQDEGSQMVAQLVDAKPGMKVIDFCAGAGGKTLAIAAQMQNKGRILAWDNSGKRLDQIKPRLKRAGIDNVQTHVIASEHDAFIKRHKCSADRVLADVPCSGSGTWRRNPDLKWRFTQKDLEDVLLLQQSILQSAARLVKPGGRLIYATCSILKNENENQISQLLKTGNNFKVVCAKKICDKINAVEMNEASYLRLTSHQDGVDGFFAAVLERAVEGSSQ